MRACVYAIFLLIQLMVPHQLQAADMLHPKFPVVEGRYQMTKEWSVALPEKFNRRIEDGSLVIWRPGFTMWISVWGNDKNETKKERLGQLRTRISGHAFDLNEAQHANVLLFSYRLKEDENDKRVPALYGFAFGESGHVQIGIYFNQESDLAKARVILGSLRETAP
jgi:hypothetical protein